MSRPRPAAGDRAEVAAEVTEADTAIALESGDVPVLGTPRLIALCEAATLAAAAPSIEPGTAAVGVEIHMEHLAAAKVGAKIRAVAVLDEVDDRLLFFSVEAFEGDRLIGRGRVVRAVVDRDRFDG